MFILMTNKLNC